MEDRERDRRMSEDLIRRSDAIEAIENTDWYHQNRNKDMVSGANSDEHQAWYKADDIYKALEDAPTIEPKRGEWLERNSGFIKWIRCSACNHRIYQGTKTNFCPNCGAEMREREGE